MRSLAADHGLLGTKSPLNDTLMMACGAPCIDAGVEIDGRLAILVPKQLADSLEVTGLGIQHDLGAQVSKLMGRQNNSRSPRKVALDEPSHRRLALGSPIDIHKNTFGTMANYFRRDAVAVFDQHLGDVRRNVE